MIKSFGEWLVEGSSTTEMEELAGKFMSVVNSKRGIKLKYLKSKSFSKGNPNVITYKVTSGYIEDEDIIEYIENTASKVFNNKVETDYDEDYINFFFKFGGIDYQITLLSPEE